MKISEQQLTKLIAIATTAAEGSSAYNEKGQALINKLLHQIRTQQSEKLYETDPINTK